MTDNDPNAGHTCPSGPEGPLGEPGRATPAPAPTPAETKPKRGRPRTADEPLGPITVHIEPTAHDRIIRLASQRRQSVSEYLRDVLSQLFHGRS